MAIASRTSFLGLARPQESFIDLARTEDSTRVSAGRLGLSVGKYTDRRGLTFRAG